MALTPDQLAPQIRKLWPRGAAWTMAAGSKLFGLCLAAADEVSRVYGRSEDLLDEAHPGTIDELLDEWETDWGLPESYVTAAQTDAQRNDAILSKLRQIGGQSRGYYMDVSAALGAVITITEGLPADPFIVGVDGPPKVIGSGVYNPFVWTVHTSAALPDAVKQSLEGALTRLKPAHTTVLFSYE